MVDLIEANGSNVTGKLFLRQDTPQSSVRIKGEIYNLKLGLHGFHVHEFGATTNDCLDSGGHFNPTNVSKLNIVTFDQHLIICSQLTNL